MITQINGEAIKGLSFKQPIGRLTLFCGPNGTGKSARCAALMLTTMGYIPGVAKQNGEILDCLGNGEKLFVGVDLADKTHLLRRYSREDGSVSLVHMVDRKKATRDAYVQALAGTKVLDLAAFMALSDQKKIDTVFDLFPPDGDIADIDAKIETLKEKQNKAEADIKALSVTVERLHSARSALQLPAGTMGETDAEIDKTEGALIAARKQLEDAKVEAARMEATAKAEAEAERQAIIAADRADRELIAAEERGRRQVVQPLIDNPLPSAPCPTAPVPAVRPVPLPGHVTADSMRAPVDAPYPTAETSIRAILDVIERAGCTSCAAALVCKRELKKLQQRSAA